MPFISEELWQRIPRASNADQSIIIAPYPEPEQYPYYCENLEAEVTFAMEIVKTVRSLRSDYELTHKTKADLYISVSSAESQMSLTPLGNLIGTLAASNKVCSYFTKLIIGILGDFDSMLTWKAITEKVETLAILLQDRVLHKALLSEERQIR